VNKLIVALDLDSKSKIQSYVDTLEHLASFKVGLEATTAIGLPWLNDIMQPSSLMLDLKLHDIPNTICATIRAAAKYRSVWGVTIHASNGPPALIAACTAARETGLVPVIVTVLTSLDDTECRRIYGSAAQDTVLRFTRWADEAGAGAIVCSPLEAGLVRRNLDDPKRVLIITPGIRPTTAATNDQARVTTPKGAVEAGATHIVVGRPILEAASPQLVAQAILQEIA
jgi:orotidine-5'-phosphate decarboxylase